MSSDMTNTLMQMLLNQKLSERAAVAQEQRDSRKFLFDQRAEIAKEERQQRRKIEFEKEKARLKAAEAGNTLSSELFGAGEVLAAGQINRAQSEAVTSAGAGDAQGVVNALRRAESVGGEDAVRELNLTGANEQAGKDQRERGKEQREDRRLAQRDSRKLTTLVRDVRKFSDPNSDDFDPDIARTLQDRIIKLTQSRNSKTTINPVTGEVTILEGTGDFLGQSSRDNITTSLFKKQEQLQTMTELVQQAAENPEALGAVGGIRSFMLSTSGIAGDLARLGLDPANIGPDAARFVDALQDNNLISGDVTALRSLSFEEMQLAYTMAQAFRDVGGNRVSAKEIDRMLKRFRIVGGLQSSRDVIATLNKARDLVGKRLNTLENQARAAGIKVHKFKAFEPDELSRQISGQVQSADEAGAVPGVEGLTNEGLEAFRILRSGELDGGE